MTWVFWGFIIILQNASFTMVSRARNSGSYSYHAIAAIFSNGIWFIQMFMVVDVFDRARSAGPSLLLLALLFYTVLTVSSSVTTHWILRTKVERGSRKVGA